MKKMLIILLVITIISISIYYIIRIDNIDFNESNLTNIKIYVPYDNNENNEYDETIAFIDDKQTVIKLINLINWLKKEINIEKDWIGKPKLELNYNNESTIIIYVLDDSYLVLDKHSNLENKSPIIYKIPTLKKMINNISLNTYIMNLYNNYGDVIDNNIEETSNLKDNETLEFSVEEIAGEYTYSMTCEENTPQKGVITSRLILNKDNTFENNEYDCFDSSIGTGTYRIEEQKILLTYNTSGNNSNELYRFDIVDNNTLKHIFDYIYVRND